MKSKKLWLRIIGVALIILGLSLPGQSMTNESLLDKFPLYPQNNAVDLNNPFYQGNFGYRFPIELPSGINGLEPTLAMVYNSELNQEKFSGVAWELIGYNQIRRNDRQGTPWYDSRDTFILTLNGKDYVMDANGSFEDQASLHAEGSGSGSWTVYEDDGTTLTFNPSATTNKGISSWVLTEVKDLNGNAINYKYDTSLLSTEGIAYLTEINYLDSQLKPQKVYLEYVPTNALGYPADRKLEKDSSYSYWPGRIELYSKRISSIIVGDISYNFKYRLSPSSRRLMLVEIKPSDDEPVSFGYQSDSASECGWEYSSKWGLTFLNGYVKVQPGVKRWDYDLLAEDFNNDGLTDLFVQKHQTYFMAGIVNFDLDFLPQIYLNDGKGGWVLAYDFINYRDRFNAHYKHANEDPVDLHADGPYSNFQVTQTATPHLFDLNGDGFKDLILTYYYYFGAIYTWTAPIVNPSNPYGSGTISIPSDHTYIRWVEKEHVVFINDGSGRFTYQTKYNDDFTQTTIPDYLDLTGDGLVDPTPFRSTIMPILTDLNGDRYPDLFRNLFRLNQTDGTFINSDLPTEQEQFFRKYRLEVDLNGDGVSEEISYDKTTSKLTCSDSRYDIANVQDGIYCNPLQMFMYYSKEVFIDVNNDGFRDLVSVNRTYLNTAKPDLLTAVSGAESIKVGYTRIPVKTQYRDNPDHKGPVIYRWAVDKITSQDSTSSFSYNGGHHDLDRREFRGFETISVADEDGTTTYTYDPTQHRTMGLVKSVTGPDGSVSYDYSFSGDTAKWHLTHLVTSSKPTDGPESTVTNNYDADGNLTRQEQVLNDSVSGFSGTIVRNYDYKKTGNVVNALERSTENFGPGCLPKENQYFYDSKFNLTKIDSIVSPENTGSDNMTVQIGYDKYGIATSVKDAAGATTTTELLQVNTKYKKRITRNALGHESYELIETATDLTVESVDANGAKTVYTYYPDKRLKRVTRPDCGFTEYEYIKNNDGTEVNITRTLEDKDRKLLLWHQDEYDKKGNLVATLDKQVTAQGADFTGPYQTVGQPVLTQKTYTKYGQVETESLPYFEGDTPRYIRYKYEEGLKRRLLLVTRPDGTAMGYEYDDVNRRTVVIDPMGKRTETTEAYGNTTIVGYGTIPCRVVTAANTLSHQTKYYYNLEGNLLQEVDANGKAKVYYYDSLGRVYRSIDPYKDEVHYTYDANGRLKNRTDAKGQVLTYQYDLLSRLTAKVFPNGRKIEWLYDLKPTENPIHTFGIGRLGAYRDPAGTTRLGYDISGNLVQKEQAGRSLNFGYDLLNRVNQITYPNNVQIGYQYDLLGLAKVQQGNKVLAEYKDRTAFGAAQNIVYANGMKNVLNYNPDNGLLQGTSVSAIPSLNPAMPQTGGGVLLDLTYNPDKTGNILSIADRTPLSSKHPAALNETYTYDAIYRLTGATGPYGNQGYQYDAVGNILVKEGVSFNYEDPAHPYAPTSASSGFQATYDNNGNMATKRDAYGNDFQLFYDEENQLTKVTKNGNYTEEFIYDATGYRVSRKAGSLTTNYVYWGNTLLYETTAGKGIAYVWAEGKIIAKLEDSGTTYFHHDHLGSSKLQTNDTGQVISTDVTQPFGPKLCDFVLKDDFATLDKVNTSRSKITFDPENGKILSPDKGRAQDNLLANNSFVSIKSLEYQNVKILKFRLLPEEKERKIKIVFNLTGKARFKVIGEDNQEYLSKEYMTNTEKDYSFTVDLTSAPNQLYLVTMELAAGSTGLEAKNTQYEAIWGVLGTNLGELYTLPYDLVQDARSVRLSWNGTGVSFQISADNGRSWEPVENGKVTNLINPGKKLLLKAQLQVAATTFLDGYSLQVNPVQYMLFTGKVLSEEIGLVYFGARWYDPEIGRFVSVDPAEDGENWYQYCRSNPINYIDPDGNMALRQVGQMLIGLGQGVGTGAVFIAGAALLAPILAPTIASLSPALITVAQVLIAYKLVECIISDLSYVVKNTQYVWSGQAPDSKVRAYGRAIGRLLVVIVAPKIYKSISNALAKAGYTQWATVIGGKLQGLLNRIGQGQEGYVVVGSDKTISNTQKKQIETLRKGGEVKVKTYEEGRKLLDSMPELRPVTGEGIMPNPTGRMKDGFADPRGTYRGDLINKYNPTGPVHPDVQNPYHANYPHYNIKLPNGDKAAIIIIGE